MHDSLARYSTKAMHKPIKAHIGEGRDVTGYRLWLDTRYQVRPWPFATGIDRVLAELPAELPDGLTDFDVFLPEDNVNYPHGLIAREHAKTRTEMAVYRDGDALIVLLRMWDAQPLAERYAPVSGEGAGVLIMADASGEEALYLGMDPEGQHLAALWSNLHVFKHADVHSTRRLTDLPAEARTAKGLGYWAAGYRVPLSHVPGVRGSDPASLRFTACRWWGETMEPSCWATPLTWGPRLEEMGWLHLHEEPSLHQPRLYRLDFEYDAISERGELLLTLEGFKKDKPSDLTVTINTEITRHQCTGELRVPWIPEDGYNAITVDVPGQPPVVVPMEKWSGHQLFVRYPSQQPLPSLEELRTRFRAWHEVRDQAYVAPGIWAVLGKKDRYGVSHECAFEMEPYALACLYLDDSEDYRKRMREACDRLLTEQTPEGCFCGIYEGIDKAAPFVGGAFDHGSASEALLLGYRVLNDQRYLDAARRADCYHMYSLENNTNYMAFALLHLSELYELTGEKRFQDLALWYTRHAILRGMNPSGAQPGHNYYTVYGGITLKGLSKLLRILPPDHSFRPTLKERVLRYTNQMLSRQRANGLFEAHNRRFYGFQHKVTGLFEVARALPEVAPVLQPVLVHMLEGRMNSHGKSWTKTHTDTVTYAGLDLALMARFLRENKTLEGVLSR